MVEQHSPKGSDLCYIQIARQMLGPNATESLNTSGWFAGEQCSPELGGAFSEQSHSVFPLHCLYEYPLLRFQDKLGE